MVSLAPERRATAKLAAALAPPPQMRTVFSPLLVATAVVLCLGLLVSGSAILATGGPAVALLSTATAAVSVPALLAIILWLDRYEPEPPRYLIAAVAWGAVVASAVALAVEQAVLNAGTDPAIATAFIAPIVEEVAKATFLLALVWRRRRQVDGLLDGIVYGALLGLGFAFTENIAYYARSYAEGGSGYLTSTFIVRGVFGPFAHPMFTAVIGAGIGLAVVVRRHRLRLLAITAGAFGGTGLHIAWNASSVYGGFNGYITTYLVGMIPVAVILGAVGVWARRREADILGSALELCTGRGWFSADAITWIASLPNRVTARRWARQTGGRPAARLVADYQQTLTELAFLHWRITWGAHIDPLKPRLAALASHATRLGPWISWPPPEEADDVDIDHVFTEHVADLGAEIAAEQDEALPATRRRIITELLRLNAEVDHTVAREQRSRQRLLRARRLLLHRLRRQPFSRPRRDARTRPAASDPHVTPAA